MRTSRQRSGDDAEGVVAARLAAGGWTILARQLRLGRDELDIVAVDPGPPPALVIVEVRYRASRAFGLPEETFDGRKRARVARAATRLVSDGRYGLRLPRLPLRIDLAVVEPPALPGGPPRVRHHRSALG